MDVNQFIKKLSLSFTNETLLQQAFTHSSYVNEHQHKHLRDNERLEFLGDAVLELAVSDYLFLNYPEMAEGEMTRFRAQIVCEESLYHFAETLDLGTYVLLGKGEERTGGRKRQALLADIFEAFLGALYLDQGMDVCQEFLNQHVFPHIKTDAFSYEMDYKTALQEIVQSEKDNTLTYHIIKTEGPSHERKFSAEVVVNEHREVGQGKSKKEAEQHAAAQMIRLLKSL